jgi:hypothetical protein
MTVPSKPFVCVENSNCSQMAEAFAEVGTLPPSTQGLTFSITRCNVKVN